MEMGRSGNGGGKVVTFDDAVTGRRRNSSSLSSYLDMGRDADGGRATPRPLPLPAHAMASRRRTYADGELDVFSAERYFKGAMEGFSVTTPAVAVPLQQPLVETRPPPAEAVVIAKPSSTRASTVSFAASSASASSANSQTALFRGGLRRRRSSGRDSNRCCVQVGVLMRTCSGKRSVRVDGCAANKEAPDAAAVPAAATGIDWYRELRMHKAAALGHGSSHGLVAAGLPPSLNLGTAKVAAIGIGREVTGGEEEKEPAELTFSSSTRRRSNFTLVAPVRASVPAPSGRVGEPGGGAGSKVGRGGGAHHLHDNDDDGGGGEDAGSESSSDLFEIKSLMIDDSPYEPSEASIQWSVVTAYAAASERGDRVPARWGGGGAARGPPVAGTGNRQLRGQRPAGILAGCASHRAVDVSVAMTKAVPNAAAAVAPVAVQQRRGEGFHMARNGA